MHNPFGTIGGGNLASHAYLNAFSRLSNGLIDLICSDELKEERNHIESSLKIGKVFFVPKRFFFEKLLSVFSGRLNRYTAFSKQILKCQENRYNYIVFDHNCIAGPLVDYAKKRKIKTITIHHNYEYEYYKDNTKGIWRFLFLHHVLNNEKKAYRNSDLNLFLTEQDLKTFQKVYVNSSGNNFVLGSFEYASNFFLPQIAQNKHKDFITLSITGSLCNFQTKDGIYYFFDKLYSCISSDCKIIISGRNPSDDVVRLCNSCANVELIRNPENMNEIIQQSDIYICPTKIGGGLKLRVMDGLRNGIPVLCHEKAARGFDFFYGLSFFKIYHDEKEFALYLNELVENVKNKNFSKNFIQKKYIECFSFESGLFRLRSIFEKTFSTMI